MALAGFAGPAFHFAGIPAIMRRFPFARLLLLALLSSPLVHAELPETDWLELMPPADRKALEEMPDIVHDTPEAAGTFTSKGGPEAVGPEDAGGDVFGQDRRQPDGKAVRLGGYPVPLENDAKGRVTEFFLVPYPGACIHAAAAAEPDRPGALSTGAEADRYLHPAVGQRHAEDRAGEQ